MTSVLEATTAPLWTAHPLVDLDPRYRKLSDAEFTGLAEAAGLDAALAYHAAREERIRNATGWFLRDGKWLFDPDPLRHGCDLPHWKQIRELFLSKEEVYCFGGNDGGKTTLIGKLVGEVLLRKLTWPNMKAGAPRVLCVAQNETMSIAVQQRAIYEHLPAEIRRSNDAGGPKKRNSVSKLNYSLDTGFTRGSFALANPRGAQCLFRNVSQFERNELGLEGDYFTLAVVDESCPLKLLEAIQFRTAKANGKILYAFTPVNGWDAVINNVLSGATIKQSLPMQWDWTRRGVNDEIAFPEIDLARTYVPGCAPGHMPFVLQPLDHAKGVVFMWSQWNPFPPRAKFNRHLPKIADKCVGRGHRMTLCRLFGYTDKLATALVPNFRPEYYPNGHLMKHADLVELLRKTPHNLRHSVDPATARSWFQGWKAVCENGLDARPMQYLVWESPNATEGEWVTPDGERGDGQRLFAEWGVDDYKRYIRETEAKLMAQLRAPGVTASGPTPELLRSGDPRGFAATMGDGNMKYLELFLRDDSAKDARLGPMYFRPSTVKSTVKDDVQLEGKLMDLLACDWTKPLDATNHPHLLVSDACQNTIRCILNCPEREPDSPWKDGLDMTRYLFDQEIPYIDPEVSSVTGGGGWT